MTVSEDNAAKRIWNYLTTCHATKGDKINLTRWFGYFYKAQSWIGCFHIRLFVLVHLAINLGILDSKGWANFEVRGKLQGPKTDKSAVSRDAEQLGALRKLTKNNLHLSVAILFDHTTYPIMRMLLAAVKYITEWYHAQSVELRSCFASQAWFVDQVRGKFWLHLVETVGVLSDRTVLEDIGLLTSGPADSDESVEAKWKDMRAEQFGRLCFKFPVQRAKRFLWAMIGWPARACLFGSADAATRTAAGHEFMRDQALHTKALGYRGKFWNKVNKRSVFHLTTCKQIQEILGSRGGVVDDDVNQWGKETFQVIIGSKGSEDGLCRLRRKEETSKTRHPRASHVLTPQCALGNISVTHFLPHNMSQPTFATSHSEPP